MMRDVSFLIRQYRIRYLLMHLLLLICFVCISSCSANEQQLEPEAVETEQQEMPTLDSFSVSTDILTVEAEQHEVPAPNSFSVSTDALNFERPESVLEEIAIFLGGGGGRGSCPAFEDSGSPYIPHEIDSSLFSGIVNREPNVEAELAAYFRFSICGWGQYEHLNISLISPSGEIETQTVALGTEEGERVKVLLNGVDIEITRWAGERGGGEISVTVIVGPRSQNGEYGVRFEGERGSVETQAIVADPFGPRFDKVDPNGKTRLLYGFKPYEKVAIAVFQRTGNVIEDKFAFSFYGWQEYVMDEKGRALLGLEEVWEYQLFPIGEISGEPTILSNGQKVRVSESLPIIHFSGFRAQFYEDLEAPPENFCAGDMFRFGAKVRLQENIESVELNFRIKQLDVDDAWESQLIENEFLPADINDSRFIQFIVGSNSPHEGTLFVYLRVTDTQGNDFYSSIDKFPIINC